MKDNQWTLIPDYKQAYRAIMMFKDEFQLDFINMEELGMREEEVDESHIIEVDLEDRANKELRDPDALLAFVKSKIVDQQLYFVILDEVIRN